MQLVGFIISAYHDARSAERQIMVVKSIGLNRFGLLGSSSSSSVDASSFVCVVLALYFTVNCLISSLIAGTFNSAL